MPEHTQNSRAESGTPLLEQVPESCLKQADKLRNLLEELRVDFDFDAWVKAGTWSLHVHGRKVIYIDAHPNSWAGAPNLLVKVRIHTVHKEV